MRPDTTLRSCRRACLIGVLSAAQALPMIAVGRGRSGRPDATAATPKTSRATTADVRQVFMRMYSFLRRLDHTRRHAVRQAKGRSIQGLPQNCHSRRPSAGRLKEDAESIDAVRLYRTVY